MNSVRFLRTVSWLEGASFLLLLFVAMPLKYWMGLPQAVRVTGMVHGVLFIGLIYVLLRVSLTHRWPVKRALWVFGAAFIPFGPFLIDKLLLQAARAEEQERVSKP